MTEQDFEKAKSIIESIDRRKNVIKDLEEKKEALVNSTESLVVEVPKIPYWKSSSKLVHPSFKFNLNKRLLIKEIDELLYIERNLLKAKQLELENL